MAPSLTLAFGCKGLHVQATQLDLMPNFSQHGDFYSVAYITGPTHTLLQISLSEAPPGTPSLVPLGTDTGRVPSPLDPQKIGQAVLLGMSRANAELGTAFHPATIRYVIDDTPSYPLYSHCAELLVRRLATGEPFSTST